MASQGMSSIDPDDFLRLHGSSCTVGGIHGATGNLAPFDDLQVVTSVKSPSKKEFVAAAFDPKGIWTIPVWLESEANRASNLKGVIQRKAAVKRAVFKALAPAWRVTGPIGDRLRAVKFDGSAAKLPTIHAVRLGGNGLDISNLWRCMKNVEDCICTLLGVDDGWKEWQDSFQPFQEPRGPWGLRIEMVLEDEPTQPLTPTDHTKPR